VNPTLDDVERPLDFRALGEHGRTISVWTLADRRPDALDEAGTEVFLDARGGVRRRAAQLVGLELFAVFAVLHPRAASLELLAGHRAWQVADNRDEAAPPARHDAQHRKARVRVVEGDALDDAAEGFRHSRIVTRFSDHFRWQ
jgi:hypothetical protein